MNKETIDKAARNYAESIPQHDERKKYSREDFKAGAKWRIDSAWHSTKDLPEHSGHLAVLMDNGIMETTHYTAGIGFDDIRLKGYSLWAYVSDLVLDKEEEM